jgi:hypothetical protein
MTKEKDPTSISSDNHYNPITEDPIPLYADISVFEDPNDQFRKKIHNDVANHARKMIQEANEKADEMNTKWVPKFRILTIIGKIRDFLLMLFGLGVLFFGVFMGYSESGFAPLTIEQIGVILAGIGLAVTSLYSLISFNDDLFHLVVISRVNENQVFATLNAIQAQLSFLRNEIIDIKKSQLRELEKKEKCEMVSTIQQNIENTIEKRN